MLSSLETEPKIRILVHKTYRGSTLRKTGVSKAGESWDKDKQEGGLSWGLAQDRPHGGSLEHELHP